MNLLTVSLIHFCNFTQVSLSDIQIPYAPSQDFYVSLSIGLIEKFGGLRLDLPKRFENMFLDRIHLEY
jgi:hypothetical protein